MKTIQITMKNAWPECKIFNWKVTCMLLMCFLHYDNNNVTTLHRTLIGYLRQTEILAIFLFLLFFLGGKDCTTNLLVVSQTWGVKLHINSRPSFNLSERWNLFFNSSQSFFFLSDATPLPFLLDITIPSSFTVLDTEAKILNPNCCTKFY